VHQDVEALLAVQADDVVIHDLESRLTELAPRLGAMQQEIDRAMAAVAQAAQAVAFEERRQREVQARVAQHRQLQERNQAQLNTITDSRQATAAIAQLDQTKRMIDEDERELQALAGRLAELRRDADDRQLAVDELRQAQEEARASLGADHAELQRQLDEYRRERATKAARVSRSLLARYERIARRHLPGVFPLIANSCANCNTTLPLQRRAAMAGTGVTELCEGCGVLLYATD